MVSYLLKAFQSVKQTRVLILIVVDNGLVQPQCASLLAEKSLNPYCSGQWSRTGNFVINRWEKSRLNPYCSGQWSRTINSKLIIKWRQQVLILIVVDNGLVQHMKMNKIRVAKVLILIVVDNGLVHERF